MAKHIMLALIRLSLLVLLFALVFPSCEPPTDYRLKIVNQTSQDWLYCISLNDSLPNRCPFPYLFSPPEEYPEVAAQINGWRGGREELLKAGEERLLAAGNGSWNDIIRRSKKPNLASTSINSRFYKTKGLGISQRQEVVGP